MAKGGFTFVYDTSKEGRKFKCFFIDKAGAQKWLAKHPDKATLELSDTPPPKPKVEAVVGEPVEVNEPEEWSPPEGLKPVDSVDKALDAALVAAKAKKEELDG